MTKTPIEPGDIRKGDLIRKEYRVPLGVKTALEYVASFSGDAYASDKGTYFRLDRPKPYVALPTEVGRYLANGTELVTLHRNGEWLWNGDGSLAIVWTAEEMQRLAASLTKLEPVAETAKRVTDAWEAWRSASSWETLDSARERIAKEFGVTS